MNYRRDAITSPRLAGIALHCTAAAAGVPGLGPVIRRLMIEAAGIPAFRTWHVTDPPAVAPRLPSDCNCQNAAAVAGAPALCEGLNTDDSPPDATLISASDITRAYRTGVTNPQAVAETFLQAVRRADASEPPLRAFIAIDAYDVRAQAERSAKRWRCGHPLGPLDGVPVAIKDELDQVPYRTTGGSSFLGAAPASADAAVVERLRGAGALLVGKTNMHELGLGVTGINCHHGTSRNPYDPDRITGGSSGGAAAAVAAGLCPIAIGADAGGSIRIPAALCGVVGLKPTFGRVSERGATPLCWSIAHIGPIGRTVRDVALAYRAIAGVDAADENTHHQPAPKMPQLQNGDLSKVSLGIFRPWFDDADADVVAACQRVLDTLAGLGASVRDVQIPDLHLVRPVHAVTAAVEWAEAFREQFAKDPAVFGHDVRLLLELARSLEPTDYLHAQRLRRRIASTFAAALREVDAIVTPTTAISAPPVPNNALGSGESDLAGLEQLSRFVTVSNLTGFPAISLPAGVDARGLPIGIQLIGPPWREDLLLEIAAVIERFHERRLPRIHFQLIGRGVSDGADVPASVRTR